MQALLEQSVHALLIHHVNSVKIQTFHSHISSSNECLCNQAAKTEVLQKQWHHPAISLDLCRPYNRCYFSLLVRVFQRSHIMQNSLPIFTRVTNYDLYLCSVTQLSGNEKSLCFPSFACSTKSVLKTHSVPANLLNLFKKYFFQKKKKTLYTLIYNSILFIALLLTCRHFKLIICPHRRTNFLA